MRKLLSLVLLTILPVLAIAGPKEDAFKVIEQFKMAFELADVPGDDLQLPSSASDNNGLHP